MTRTTTGSLDIAFSAGHVPFILFIKIEYDSGDACFTTAGHNITWDSLTWYGLGSLISIEEVREGETLEAIGVKVTLSSIPSAMLSLAMSEHIQGRPCRIWAGALDDGLVVVDPSLEFVGRLDTMQISEDGQTGSVSVNIESRLADFARPRIRRFSQADQQQLYPGDMGFQYVAQMAEKQLVWPGKEFFKR